MILGDTGTKLPSQNVVYAVSNATFAGIFGYLFMQTDNKIGKIILGVLAAGNVASTIYFAAQALPAKAETPTGTQGGTKLTDIFGDK